MKRTAYSLIIVLTALSVLTARAAGAERPNVLLLCIDDLRPELACFGVEYIQSPNIDALAARGRAFDRHYVQAPTCGASRYTLLTGMYGPYGNGALFQRAKKLGANPQQAKKLGANPDAVPPSLPGWFRQHGYTTISIGKVSHHPGGWGGSDWDDPSQVEMPNAWDQRLMPVGPWQHPRGAMHGLARGEIRKKAGDMDVFQAAEGPDSIYPDGLITQEAINQLDRLAGSEQEKPFFLTVGIIRPHLPFGAPAKYMEPYKDVSLPPTPHPEKPDGRTTWHGSGEFMNYNRWGRNPNRDAEFAIEVRKHYAACVSYADALVGRILDRLDELELRDDTLIVLWGDHGWHLGEHAVWGKHTLFEESLRSPLIISCPDMSEAGESTPSIVETIDLYPTLCELADLPRPGDFLHGTSLVPILDDPETPGHDAVSYKGNVQTIRTDTHRLIAHNNGHLELYDYRQPDGETRNIAESEPETAKKLLEQLRLKREP
ncbi:MAG: sulfatase [Planctomycetota bacterium]